MSSNGPEHSRLVTILYLTTHFITWYHYHMNWLLLTSKPNFVYWNRCSTSRLRKPINVVPYCELLEKAAMLWWRSLVLASEAMVTVICLYGLSIVCSREFRVFLFMDMFLWDEKGRETKCLQKWFSYFNTAYYNFYGVFWQIVDLISSFLWMYAILLLWWLWFILACLLRSIFSFPSIIIIFIVIFRKC